MRINGMGLVCKECRREMSSDDVTFYASRINQIPVANTNCCKAKVVKKNWFDKLKEKLRGR